MPFVLRMTKQDRIIQVYYMLGLIFVLLAILCTIILYSPVAENKATWFK